MLIVLIIEIDICLIFNLKVYCRFYSFGIIIFISCDFYFIDGIIDNMEGILVCYLRIV